jgi:hypothetical protein
VAAVEIEVDVTGTEEAGRDVSSLKDTFKEFGTTAAAVGGVIATGAAALRAFAMEADRQGAIIAGFTGSLNQSRQAMGGMVSDLQMMQAHSRLASAGLNLSGQDLRNVLVTAFQQADRTGQDFNQTLDRLGQAIVRGGRGLREFGVEARTPNEALAQLAENLGDAEIEADSLGDRFEQLDTTLENMSTSFMESVEATGGLESAFTELFNAVNDGESSFDDAMDSMAEKARLMGLVVGRTVESIGSVLAAQARGWRELFDGNFEAAATNFSRSHERLGEMFSGDRIEQIANEHRGREIVRGVNEQIAEATNRETRITRRGGRGRGGGDRQQAARNLFDFEDPWSEAAIDARLEREEEFFESLRDLREQDAEHALQAAEDVEKAIDRLSYENLEAKSEADKREHREAMERAREEMELRLEMLEEQKQKAREASEAVRDDAMGVLQPVVKGLTDALRDVIAGTKSADEAFQGMLASFLEMIAQETALQAAKEFAEAIAAFARYDYSGGAQHLAAGVAYTAVAVAAGAASVAVAPSAAAPAQPDEGGSQQQGGGVSYTVNYNGPVISAGDRAEVGRTLDELVSEGRRRFGAAA